MGKSMIRLSADAALRVGDHVIEQVNRVIDTERATGLPMAATGYIKVDGAGDWEVVVRRRQKLSPDSKESISQPGDKRL